MSLIPFTPIATFDIRNSTAFLEKLEAKIEPVQDLHGYDSPWPAGGGKNKYPIDVGDDVWVNNGSATHSKDSSGNLAIVTSASSSNSGVYLNTASATLSSVLSSFGNNPRVVSFDIVASASGTVRLTSGNTATFEVGTTKQRISIVSTNTGCSIYGVNNGATLTISNLQVEAGSTASAYEPFENICPIAGWTGVDVYRSGADTSNPTTYEITWQSEAGTVYGAEVDVTNGFLTVLYGNIASYAGESLPSTWLSSLDLYASGTTPTTGAQVVYKLAEPITYSITPAEITLLLGENNIWSNAGDVQVQYSDSARKQIKLNDVDVTSYFVQRGMTVTYAKVTGSNGGTMLSGDREEDVLAWKAVVTLTCMPLTPAQQADFLAKVMVADPTLYYFDPLTNGYKTIHYMASISETTYKGNGGTGIEFWTGLVLTAEEK